MLLWDLRWGQEPAVKPTPAQSWRGRKSQGVKFILQWQCLCSPRVHRATAGCHAAGAVLPVGLLPSGGVPSPGALAQRHPAWGRGQRHGVLGGSSGSCVRFCSRQRSEHQPPFTRVVLPSARDPEHLLLPALPGPGCPRCPTGAPGGSSALLRGEVAPSAGMHGHCTGLPPTPKNSAWGEDGCSALHPGAQDSTLLQARAPLRVPGAPLGSARRHQLWCAPDGR